MTLQSYTRVLERPSPHCVLNIIRISAVFTFTLVRTLKITRCATADGTTCSLIVITTYEKLVDTKRFVISATSIPYLTISKVILFYAEFSALRKVVRFIFELFTPMIRRDCFHVFFLVVACVLKVLATRTSNINIHILLLIIISYRYQQMQPQKRRNFSLLYHRDKLRKHRLHKKAPYHIISIHFIRKCGRKII